MISKFQPETLWHTAHESIRVNPHTHKLDELDCLFDDLCLGLQERPETIADLVEWKRAHKELRNRVRQVPAFFADKVFDVYKETVLESSYYFSISELLVFASLAGVSLVAAFVSKWYFSLRRCQFCEDRSASVCLLVRRRARKTKRPFRAYVADPRV